MPPSETSTKSQIEEDCELDADLEYLRMEVYGNLELFNLLDIIKTIRDPEEPGTLEELKMVNEDLITVKSTPLAFK